MVVVKMCYYLLCSCLPSQRAKRTFKHTYACYATAVAVLSCSSGVCLNWLSL